MRMVIMAGLLGIASGAIVSFAVTVYVLRNWAAQEEERRRKAREEARRHRMARRREQEQARREDVFFTLSAAQERHSEPNIALFPTEETKSGTGRIRGAYRGPDGAVTFVGMDA